MTGTRTPSVAASIGQETGTMTYALPTEAADRLRVAREWCGYLHANSATTVAALYITPRRWPIVGRRGK